MRSLTPGLLLFLSLLAAPIPAPARAVADSATASPGVAATVGDRRITLDEVDRHASGAMARIRQEQYEARAQALDAIVNEEVLAREARFKHVTSEQLVRAEVEAKQKPPTTAEIDTFFVQNRGRMSGRPLEEMRPQISESLRSTGLATARADYIRSLRRKYGVRLALEPPRVAVSADDDPARGPATAPVTIVEFSDFQCPFCSRAEAVIDTVLARYGARVRLVFRDFPLSIHPNAEPAARASECARAQGKYWPMNRAMFASPARLSSEDLIATAANLGLDVSRFRSCLESGESRAEVEKDVADGEAYGVTGTPTFFVNGVMIVGARELSVFTDTIDRELERLGK